MSNRSINKVTLLGNLTRDPELKYTPAGTAVCTFGLATNRSWTTADGQTKERAQFHRIVAWQKLAELCDRLLNKGRKAYVEGRITYREFTDKNGNNRNITEIVLDDFIVFNDGRRSGSSGDESDNGSDNNNSDSNYSEEDNSQDNSPNETEESNSANAQNNNDNDEDINPDDIPF